MKSVCRNESGLTVLETMVMLLIVSLILIAVPVSLRSGTEVWERGNRHNEILQNALIGMEELTRELRQAKEILDVSPSTHTNGFIEFCYYHDIDGDGDTVDNSGNREFKYQRYEYDGSNDNLQYAWSSNASTDLSSNMNILAGPVSGLSFTCYRDQHIPATIPPDATHPDEIKQIREVHIKMTTYDDQGKVNPVPLSSRVYLRTWVSLTMDEFAIFGDQGVTLDDQPLIIGTSLYQPSNVGANADIVVGQHTNVGGNLHHGASGALIAQTTDVSYWNDYGYDEYILMPNPTNFADPKWWNGIDPVWAGADPTINNGNVKLKNGETLTLAPGRYGELRFGNNSTLILTVGTYWFTNISAKNNVVMHFDVSGGDIRFFIDSYVDLGNTLDASNTITGEVEGGTAANVYCETHYGLLEGEGEYAAWSMGQNTTWVGGIYAPYGDIDITDGAIYGQMISAKTVTVHGGSTQLPGINTTTINFVRNNHLRDYGYIGQE